MTRSLPCLVFLAAWSLCASLQARVMLVEIHYHPLDGDDPNESLEFVEIFNDEPLPFEISGYRIDGGVGFVVPPETIVPARGVLVIAREPDALRNKTGLENVVGPYSGRLANDGERVELIDTGGSVVSSVRYNDGLRWPAAADGAGASLVLRSPEHDVRKRRSWGWSAVRNGTPGVVSFEVVESEVLLNEVYRVGDDPSWIELIQPLRQEIDLSGYFVAFGPHGRERVQLGEGTILGAGDHLVLGEDVLGEMFRSSLRSLEPDVYILRPDGVTVVDGIRLGEPQDTLSDARFPDAGERWESLAPSPAASNTRDELPIVISELQYHSASGEVADEFIEIANVGTEGLSLEGMKFVEGVRFEFPVVTIEAGAYVVVARDPESIESNHGIGSVLGPYEGSLSNSGETLRLVDAAGRLVDEVRYHDSGVWSRWADGDGPSLELVDLRSDNSVGSSWAESEHESEWMEVDVTKRLVGSVTDSEFHIYLMGAGEVLIDDLSLLRVGSDRELLTNGAFDGEDALSGWRIEGTHIRSQLEIGGGPDGSNALRIVASKRGDTRANRLETQTSPSLGAGEYRIRFKARWLRGSRLLMLRSHGHGMVHIQELEAAPRGGTPGRENSRSVANVGPSISSLRQDPALPSAGESVRFEVAVSDPDGVESAHLLYRVDGEEAFTRSVLLDDGLNGDRLAGDGEYSIVLDEIGSPGAIVEFYVEARDASKLARTLPSDGESQPFVFTFDDEVEAHEIPAMRVVMSRRDLSELRSRSVHSNERLPSSLVTGRSQIFHGAGIRYRGSVFVRRDEFTGNRKGLRVNLPPDNVYRGDERIVFDEQEADNTRQVDRVVRDLLQRAGGIPYGERRYVHLILPGGEDLGTYEQVLAVDGAYLERAFGAEGASGELYKTDTHYELDDRGDFSSFRNTNWRYTSDKERLRFIYKKRSHEDQDDFSKLSSLIQWVDPNQTNTADFEAAIEDRVDMDAWIRSLAVYRAAEDWDTIGGWTGKNVYLYAHPDGRWRIIPWDHDVALGATVVIGNVDPRAYVYTPHHPEIRRLLQRPKFDRRFLAELERIANDDLHLDRQTPILQSTWELLRTTSRAASPTARIRFIQDRVNYLQGTVLRNQREFEITSPDTGTTTEQSTISITGMAPYRVRTLILDGEQAPVEWATRDRWSLSVSLSPGENDIELFAFDARGNFVDTASVSVTYEAPADHFVRADVNGDGILNISDAVGVLRVLFQGEALSCEDAADSNDDGDLNLTDAVYALLYLFLGGDPPPAPYPGVGPDPTEDTLTCG
ncbi:MAG: lamin tail domain-containing protein [Planctomycetota bacterium]